MKSYTLSAVALFAVVVIVQGSDVTNLKRDFSESTSFERFLVQLTHPEIYNNISTRSGSKSSGLNSDNPIVDFLNFDLPTLALQLSKLGESTPLPSLGYIFSFYYCFIGVCAGVRQVYVYSDPVVRNANLTSLNTKINTTNIELEFEIPDLQIIIDNFTLSDTDIVNGGTDFYKGLTFTIKNYTLQLTADLEYTPDVGIQVSNVAINFGVEDFRTLMGYEEGNVIEKQYAEQIMADWVEVGAEVTTTAELLLNCFLSKGRNGNAGCEDVLADKYQTENFVQLLQSIGLSIFQSQEDRTENAVAEINIKNQFLNFLPHFPTLEINSILLDISTLILQLGKLLYDPQSNEVPFNGYVLFDEVTRENCTNGICRDIVHQMQLSDWILGGFSENLVQLDIQPANFSYSLNVPNFYLHDDEFQYLVYDLENSYEEVYLGLQSSIVDAEFALTGDYEFKDDFLQVSNLNITLRLGELPLRIPEFYTVKNGVKSESQEYMADAAPQIMEMWTVVGEDGVSFERKYEQQVQDLLNSYLRDGGLID